MKFLESLIMFLFIVAGVCMLGFLLCTLQMFKSSWCLAHMFDFLYAAMYIGIAGIAILIIWLIIRGIRHR